MTKEQIIAAARAKMLANIKPASQELQDFAKTTLAAAATTDQTARPFGSHKVYTHRAYQQVTRRDGRFTTLESFKAGLIEATREGLIKMSRADLVEELAPADVAASKVQVTSRDHWNFILIG